MLTNGLSTIILVYLKPPRTLLYSLPKIKKARYLTFLSGNMAFFLLSSLNEFPSSVTPIFYSDYWFLSFDNFFNVNRGMEKVNNNE